MANRNAASMGSYGATWEAHGYCGQGNVEGLIDSLRSRTVVIVGPAEGDGNLFEEAEDVIGRFSAPVVFAVNDVGIYLPNFDHWISLHADNLTYWEAVRHLTFKKKKNYATHSFQQNDKAGIDHLWDKLTPTFALSGSFAMQVAHIMGAERILLVGCPGSPMRKFCEARPRETFGYGGGIMHTDKNVRAQVTLEMLRLPELKAKVRSNSGWTKEYFGGI